MAKKSNPVPVLAIVFGVIAVLVVVAIAFGGGSDEADGDAVAFGDVEVAGTPLARLGEDGSDPSAGAPMPEVVGADFDGNEVALRRDGRPKIILFLTHW